jgi:hypothetical protein
VSGAYGQCWAQNRQVRTHFCRERAGNLCEKTWKNAASQGQEWSIKRGEKMKNCCNPGVSREKKMNLMNLMMMMTTTTTTMTMTMLVTMTTEAMMM